MLWNMTSGEIDKLLEKFNNSCTRMKYYTPDFKGDGLRISEVKCLEHIWRIRYDIAESKREFLKCTIKIMDPFVAGGDDVEIGEIPSMGAIGWSGTSPRTWIFKCGGVLISDKYVLTAAHCSRVSRVDTTVSDVSPKIVRFGAVNILDVYKYGFPPKDHRISKIIVHDKYNAPKKYFDIGLIELERKVKFTRSAHPACLWTKNSEISGKATVAGWGVVDTVTRRTSSILQVATVDMVPSNECNNTLKSRRNRNWSNGPASHQICAGHMAGGIDACQGDSGGPLHIKLNMPIDMKFEWRMHYVVGVTSFGHGCALANTPSVFSKVSHFVDWIENIVWGEDVNTTLKTGVESRR